MPNGLKIAIDVCTVLIAYVYPFVVVYRGQPIGEISKKIWLVLIAYFLGVCLGIPAIGWCFSPELGRELAMSVPEAPIIVPILFCGWMCPMLAGGIAIFVRRLAQRKRTPPMID